MAPRSTSSTTSEPLDGAKGCDHATADSAGQIGARISTAQISTGYVGSDRTFGNIRGEFNAKATGNRPVNPPVEFVTDLASVVKPFPWHGLDRISVQQLAMQKHLRASFRETFSEFCPELIATTMQYLLGIEESISFAVPRFTALGAAAGSLIECEAFVDGATCLLINRNRQSMLLIQTEAEFAFRLASIIIGYDDAWLNRSVTASQHVDALWGAFVVAVMHKMDDKARYSLAAVGELARQRFVAFYTSVPADSVGCARLHDGLGQGIIDADAVVTMGQNHYGLDIRWWGPMRMFQNELLTQQRLMAMGDIELNLKIVASLCTTARNKIASLARGDAWVVPLEQGQQLRPCFHGNVLLMPSNSTVAWRARLRQEGGVVIEKKIINTIENNDQQGNRNPDDSSNILSNCPQSQRSQPPEHVFADVPVVVRIELGAVSLSAKQWALLQSGDVITTGYSVGSEVTLRIGGIEVAKGDLVDVQGNLGVRINRLLTTYST